MEATTPAPILDFHGLEHSALAELCHQYDAVMLFGSVARGDAESGSDVDVLVLSEQPAALRERVPLSVTSYSPLHLEMMARHGSLFVLHLRSEGRVLVDRHRKLEEILRLWVQPDYDRMREGIRAATALLDVNPECFRNERSLQIAIFLLRSVLYLDCARKGAPTFGMRAVSHLLDDARIANFFGTMRRKLGDERIAALRLSQAKVLLADRLDGLARNPFGTLEALAVSWHHQYPMASHLAVQLLTDGRGIDYGNAPANWTEP
jgi:predicted nucleotidyltransferase